MTVMRKSRYRLYCYREPGELRAWYENYAEVRLGVAH